MKGKIVVLVFESSQFTKAAVGLAPAISGSSTPAGSPLLCRFFNYQLTANGKILILYLSQALG